MLSPPEWLCIKAGSCVRQFNISLTVWAKSEDIVHKPQCLKRKESWSRSNRGPSAYQPSALPLGHTGSRKILERWCWWLYWNRFFRLSFCPYVWFCPDDISWSIQPFLTKLGMVVYYYEAIVIQKNCFTNLNVKVTVRAYIIKIWLYLLYLLNCWSICNQTLFDSIASEVRVFCGKIGLLHMPGQGHSEGSVCQWMFVWMISY